MRIRRTNPLAGVNLLELAPTRTAEWTERADHGVVVERPLPGGRGIRFVGRRIAHWMAPARIRFDSIGSFTWNQLDGRTSVGRVCDRVRDRFGVAAEPVEERVGEFMRLLHREDMVAYPLANEARGNRRER